MANVKIKGLKKTIKKLDKLGGLTVLKKPMTQSVAHLHRKIAQAPRKDPTAFSRLATIRQHRAYWARVGSGVISHGSGGYKRTGTTARKWTTSVKDNGRKGIIGNNAPGVIYVQGPRRQPFHKASGWKTIEEVADEEAGAVQDFFEDHYRSLISG